MDAQVLSSGVVTDLATQCSEAMMTVENNRLACEDHETLSGLHCDAFSLVRLTTVEELYVLISSLSVGGWAPPPTKGVYGLHAGYKTVVGTKRLSSEYHTPGTLKVCPRVAKRERIVPAMHVRDRRGGFLGLRFMFQ